MKVDKIVYMLPQWHTQQIKIPKPIKGSLRLHPFGKRLVTHHHKPNTKTPNTKNLKQPKTHIQSQPSQNPWWPLTSISKPPNTFFLSLCYLPRKKLFFFLIYFFPLCFMLNFRRLLSLHGRTLRPKLSI